MITESFFSPASLENRAAAEPQHFLYSSFFSSISIFLFLWVKRTTHFGGVGQANDSPRSSERLTQVKRTTHPKHDTSFAFADSCVARTCCQPLLLDNLPIGLHTQNQA